VSQSVWWATDITRLTAGRTPAGSELPLPEAADTPTIGLLSTCGADPRLVASPKAEMKAAYCMAVCPAGEDVIGNWLNDRRKFTQEVVRPLQHKEETIYVSEDSPAIAHATRRFPRKSVKIIDNGLGRPATRQSVDTAPMGARDLIREY
jgi:hypothetical protein